MTMKTAISKNLELEWTSEVFAGVSGLGAELLFDSQQLVVLSKSLGSAWCTGLDLKHEK
jgi:hypothetical protein